MYYLLFNLVFAKVYETETDSILVLQIWKQVLVMINNFPGLPAMEMHLQDSNFGWLFSPLAQHHLSKGKHV